MLERCWKCEQLLVDPLSSYCTYCGVPLKRILPRIEPREPLIAICSRPECDGAVTTTNTCAGGLSWADRRSSGVRGLPATRSSTRTCSRPWPS